MRAPHYFLLTDYPVNMRTMLAAAPFRCTDPATWPWMFYVWLAFLLVGWMVPVERGFRHKRAAGWPIADGRIVPIFSRKLTRAIFKIQLAQDLKKMFYRARHTVESPDEHDVEPPAARCQYAKNAS